MVRIVHARIVAAPGTVLADAEIAFSPTTGNVDYLGPTRGEAGPGDIDGSQRMVIPGLINAHTHSAMTPLRGYSDDVPLHTWLEHIRAVEVRMTGADIMAGLRLAMVEMLRSGTTAFADMFHWDAALLQAVSDAGMRVNAAPNVFGYHAVAFRSTDPRPGAAVLQDIPRLVDQFTGDPLITVSYGLHAPYTCSPELIADVAARAGQRGIGVQIHLSETRREVEQSLAKRGVSPIRHVADLGLFDTDLHIAHAVHPVDGDVELLARANVTVAHNPVSNLKLGAGIAPTTTYRDHGVRLALGTDSVASNNTLDMFEEIKTGTLLQRGLAADPEVLGGAEVFGWATRGGAMAVRGGSSGRLAVGEQADLVLLDVTGDTATPLNDPESFLYYAVRGSDVTDVFIAGRQVVGGRRVLTMDEDEIRGQVRERMGRLTAEVAAR